MKPARMIDGLIIDNFAGGGGASEGIALAFGRKVDVAINHDPEAVAMHAANHPDTMHYCQSVWRADPVEVVREAGGGPVALAWFSPDCKHFSKAKGGRPVEKNIRDLAWVVVHWARRVRPRVIMLENVEEFRSWAPLDERGLPVKDERLDGQLDMLPVAPLAKKGKRKLKPNGKTFELWLAALRKEGYRIEWRELRGCDYGAPTIRKRLFVVARCDGRPIVWPEPTHGPAGNDAGLAPYRTAAECIDWSIPCPSIFGRKKPLEENTLRRIAAGIMRFVVNTADPFIVPVTNSKWAPTRAWSTREPLRTITTAKGGEYAAVDATLLHADQAAAFMAQHNSDKGGRARAGRSMRDPVSTVVHRGTQQQVVVAHLEQANTGMVGHDVRKPLSTIVSKGCTQRLVTSHLMKLRGTCRHGAPVQAPAPTVTAGGMHLAEVRAFLVKYYGTATAQSLKDPLHTATAQARFGLATVTIAGDEYVIVDIGMRMLTPRELARAQGFPDSYVLDPVVDGKPLTKTAQIRMIGNSVNQQVAAALVAANCNAPVEQEERIAA